MGLILLISPLAKGAYFDGLLDVAQAEFRAHFPKAASRPTRTGGLDFLETDLHQSKAALLARLSFVQGIFEKDRDGLLAPLDAKDDYLLPESVVYGAKYQGKTNELVTRLALNLALLYRPGEKPAKTILDPMAGKGTTLLWALGQGLDATGIEIDPGAPEALHAHLKKQTKLHRLKHSHQKGFIGKKTKKGAAGFVRYLMTDGSLKLIVGDSKSAPDLLSNQHFDLMVTDLPYGVQFKGSKKANLRSLIESCAKGWTQSLAQDGAMVLIFNNYQPKRTELIEIFESQGLHPKPFTAPHRMSESIVRDLLVFTR